MYRHVMRQFRKFSNDFPPYVARNDESDAVQRKRLLYQSRCASWWWCVCMLLLLLLLLLLFHLYRKRGISENGLLLR